MVEASRSSELQALDLRYRVFSPDAVSFRLSSFTKKRVVGAPPKELIFGAFPEDSLLCVVKRLRQYERVTEAIRPVDSHSLFISYVKPHIPVTSQRIAQDLLTEAGVNTAVFRDHSVRGVSTSAAVAKGVSIQDIFKTANWSKESTFRKFYYRPSENRSFASKLLSLPDKEKLTFLSYHVSAYGHQLIIAFVLTHSYGSMPVMILLVYIEIDGIQLYLSRCQ